MSGEAGECMEVHCQVRLSVSDVGLICIYRLVDSMPSQILDKRRHVITERSSCLHIHTVTGSEGKDRWGAHGKADTHTHISIQSIRKTEQSKDKRGSLATFGSARKRK